VNRAGGNRQLAAWSYGSPAKWSGASTDQVIGMAAGSMAVAEEAL
jgi:hypothetical protein